MIAASSISPNACLSGFVYCHLTETLSLGSSLLNLVILPFCPSLASVSVGGSLFKTLTIALPSSVSL